MPPEPPHDHRLSPDERRRLIAADRQYVWHPFTQHSLWNQHDPLIITGGYREFVFDVQGRRYIDGHSSLWCNIHGHRRAEIDAAIRTQLGRIAHSTQLGLASPPAIELAERLIKIAPHAPATGLNAAPSPRLTKVFYSDDGSTAVEVACKLAYGFWCHRGKPQRRKFVALRNAYHGDTVGAVSLGGIDLFHRIYKPLLFDTIFISPGQSAAQELERVLTDPGEQIAAVIVEPLVQCAGGILTAPPGQLRRIRELCDTHSVLLIADEVATGFGRTGKMFACEHEGITPDLICLSKGLTGGYLPLGATLATEDIYDAFLGPIDSGRTFYHGHTFTGNPLACAAALASLDIFEQDRTLEQLQPKIARLSDHLSRIAENRCVGGVRQCGFIAGIDVVKNCAARAPFPYAMQAAAQVCLHARQYGVILRPLADTIVVMPPLIISIHSLDHLMISIERCINEVIPHLQNDLTDGLE